MNGVSTLSKFPLLAKPGLYPLSFKWLYNGVMNQSHIYFGKTTSHLFVGVYLKARKERFSVYGVHETLFIKEKDRTKNYTESGWC